MQPCRQPNPPSNLLPVVGVIALLGALITLAACSGGGPSADAATAPTATRTVTSTAMGKANGVPDNLVATVSVHTSGTTAAAVLTDNNARTKALLDRIQADGVADKDIRTMSVNLGPHYTDKGKIDGFEADNQVEVTFRDLATAGAKLDSLVQTAGDAARIQSVTLGFNDDDALRSAARTDGVKRARAQAEEMAKAAGAKLGRVRTITEVVGSTSPYPMTEVAAADTGTSVPIAARSRDLIVQVRVVFDLA